MANSRKNQKRLQRIVHEIKVSMGCARCGYNRCARALSFHHRNDDKTDNVSRLVNSGRALPVIMAEIAKCDLLCANCHLEEHDRIARG